MVSVSRGPHNMPIFHIGEELILHLLVENPENLRVNNRYIEDNLGNQSICHTSGSVTDEEVGEYASRSIVFFNYVPEATSFTLRYDFVNVQEDECDVLLFADVPIGGKGITRTLNGHAITYNGVHWHKRKNLPDSCQIHLTFNEAREVRGIGLAAITDNLGNQYDSFPGSNSGYDADEGVFYSNLQVDIDPNATSISFKYLFARKILTFELRDLPLPS